MTRADSATLLALFTARLREAGIPVAPEQTMRLARLIQLDVPRTLDELYWCARVSLLLRTADVPAFDEIFAAVFRGVAGIAELPHVIRLSPPPRGDAPPLDASPDRLSGGRFEPLGGADGDEATTTPARTWASSAEQLTEADFARLTADELAALAPLLRQLVAHPPLRLSRRRHRHSRGDRLDVRASLRRSIRSGGDPAVPVRRSRERVPRQLVALLDVSGSMQPYARAYLHLLWGAATRARAEVFTFGTRLTRLTPALRHGSPDRALERAAGLMPDWSGGTRIGRSLRSFMDGYGRRGMAHGAVVLIVSDGWERDDPALLGRQMEALARRAHHVVWANPRASAPGFAPLTAGMSAALPYVDALVSGHSGAALAEVVHALGTDRGARRPDQLR